MYINRYIQLKVKVALEQAMKAHRGEQKNSSTSLTSALVGGRW
jgi:hypothetical protein